jgi:hypothetical protein
LAIPLTFDGEVLFTELGGEYDLIDMFKDPGPSG